MKRYLMTIGDKDEEAWEDFKTAYKSKGLSNLDQALMCAAKSFTKGENDDIICGTDKSLSGTKEVSRPVRVSGVKRRGKKDSKKV